MAGVFVTATDTGVGKTFLSAALVALARAAGVAVRPLKPVLTGTEEVGVEHDHVLLGRLAGLDPRDVAQFAFPFPASPHLASALAGAPLDPHQLEQRTVAAVRAAKERDERVVVEGVGGLLVPLAPTYTVADLAAALGLPLVVVARPGLGTINHTLLTIEAARRRDLPVVAVVLNPFPAQPTPIEADNERTIEALAAVPVYRFPAVSAPTADALSQAGAHLPWRSWLGL